MSDQRSLEIKNLSEIISSTCEQIRIKRTRLERAKSVNDFALCDQLSTAVHALLRQKSDDERQLMALNKKGKKSLQYIEKKAAMKHKAKEEIPKTSDKANEKGKSVVDLLKAAASPASGDVSEKDVHVLPESDTENSDSTDTADTLILDSSLEDVQDVTFSDSNL